MKYSCTVRKDAKGMPEFLFVYNTSKKWSEIQEGDIRTTDISFYDENKQEMEQILDEINVDEVPTVLMFEDGEVKEPC